MLTTYIGPMIKIAVTDEFNVDGFCKSMDFWRPCSELNPDGEDWFLLPDSRVYTAPSKSYSLDSFYDDHVYPVLNPDIPSILEEFSNSLTTSVREAITVPYEIVWGVYGYWC